MIDKTMTLFTTKAEALDYLSTSESPALNGLAVGVKAHRRAFTLIELLVVIAIIAILAAMLLPVLNRAKANGLKAADIDNFKQLQTCYQMYVDDNNDSVPLNNLGNGATVTSWIAYITPNASAQYDYNSKNIQTATLYPYNQNARIYLCPANTYMLLVGASGAPPGPYRDDSGKLITSGTVPQTRTCSVEWSLGSGAGSTPPWTDSGSSFVWKTYQKFTSIEMTRVSEKIVFCDEASGTIDDGAWAMWPMNTGENYWWNLPGSRHDKGCIFSFADGHVEYHKWLGTAVSGSSWQTQGAGNNGQTGLTSTTIQAVTSADLVDLAWAQAGGPQYP